MAMAPLWAALSLSAISAAIWLFILVDAGRRKPLRARLAGLAAAAAPSPGREAVARAVPPRRRSLLPNALRRRLDAALEAGGRRLGLLQMMGAGAGGFLLLAGFAGFVLQFRPALALVIGGMAALLCPLALLRWAQSRYQRRFLDLFPDALDLIARAVRAGLPALEAIEVAAREIPAPVGPEFQRAIDEMRIGVDFDAALQSAADRVRAADFRFFVVTLSLQRRMGGSLAETLNNLSGVLRERKALRRKARALTAEAKISAWFIGFSPVLAGGAVYLHDHALMLTLFTDPRGRLALGLAIVSLACGMFTMNFMIKKSLR